MSEIPCPRHHVNLLWCTVPTGLDAAAFPLRRGWQEVRIARDSMAWPWDLSRQKAEQRPLALPLLVLSHRVPPLPPKRRSSVASLHLRLARPSSTAPSTRQPAVAQSCLPSTVSLATSVLSRQNIRRFSFRRGSVEPVC